MCGFCQVVCTKQESRKWMSISQPVSRRPSATSVQFSPQDCLQYMVDELLHSQSSPNGFATLSHLDLGTAIHGLPPTPDPYADFSLLLDRLEVPLAAGSGSSAMVPMTASPATSDGIQTTPSLSLSPLCFTHLQSRSRSNSPSPDTGGGPSDASVKHEVPTDTRVSAGGKAQKVKIPRHKRPSHQRAEAKRRTRIQVNLIPSSFHFSIR